MLSFISIPSVNNKLHLRMNSPKNIRLPKKKKKKGTKTIILCVTRPNKGKKKCVTDFIILQLREVNLEKWPESENRFVHFYYELRIIFY